MDRYPTYRDGPVTPHAASADKPTDTNLPRSRRTSGLPILIGVVLFGIVVALYLFTGLFNTARTTDDALTPGDAAAPAASTPATDAPATAGTDVPEGEGALDADAQAQPATGPGEVEADPGGIDVPGGDITTPVQEAPAQ
jgi:hypothetical protein